MRDAKSYCAILLDDNNRKSLIRFHFNKGNKCISLFTNKKEERIRIDGLDEIYNYAERLCNTANEYAAQ